MTKIAIFLSHPIHYHIDLYRLLAKNSELNSRVYFYSRFGIKKHFDPQFKKEIDFEKEDILQGYRYYFLKNLSKVKNFGFFDFINPEIIKEIYKNRFDYTWINSWSYLSDWFVIFSSFLFGTKLIIRSENPFSHEKLKPKWKIFFKKIFLGFIFKKTSLFFYIGEENKNFLKFYGANENKFVFTPYAVDNDFFQKEAQNLKARREEIRKNLNINSKGIVILFVGKLINKKRPLDLLLAYEKISGEIKNKDVYLIFVGDGELREKIENLIQEKKLDKVIITGFVSQKDISKFYAISDIFVLPSGIGETWGLVVNEAMNFGLPIIVSDLVGCGKDLVKVNENGYIFKCGNIDELSLYLKDLILNEEKRKKFGEKSLEIVKNYSFDASVNNIFDYFYGLR